MAASMPATRPLYRAPSGVRAPNAGKACIRTRPIAATSAPSTRLPMLTDDLCAREWDAVVIGSGVGGLSTATEMSRKGAKVLVLESYIIPGGSAGQFERQGYKFDVGSSMMFGLSDASGGANLITRALANVGKRVQTVADPSQLVYHLPRSQRHPHGLEVRVPRSFDEFMDILVEKFPHEEEGIRAFYGECWTVFTALNKLELRTLEEIKFLMQQFVKEPLACLTLAKYFISNAGDIARQHIRDPEVLAFVDIECYLWSTVLADNTPMISTGMVLCDRHHGGINYPVGGVGEISRLLVEGLQENGGAIAYKAPVDHILTEPAADADGGQRAVGVRLRDGREIRSKVVVSNATRWDTFGKLLEEIPENEKKFRSRYVKAPSFLSMHLGVRASCIPEGSDCHHIVMEHWDSMQDSRGTLFVSIPSILDPSLAPEGMHTFHAFSPDTIEDYEGLSAREYDALKQRRADAIIDRLERACFPGLRGAIEFREVGSPRTHQKFLNREDGTYGPVPMRPPRGILSMPFNRTDTSRLYCAGDSTFPGQGVNAVVFSGFGAAHCALCDLGMEDTWSAADKVYTNVMTQLRYNT